VSVLEGSVELNFNQCFGEEMRFEGTERREGCSVCSGRNLLGIYFASLLSLSWSTWQTTFPLEVNAFHKVASHGKLESAAVLHT